ncbi:DUF4177 domain-containing protein [Thalassorhabdomicrobium marinisediminis]|uniref:DUF4177 domain-containing protein n=1 Tax=Thalassorhabdomicrobium marinisediminis TaxID=2170577 RepID=A0A2T7FXZ1_9RHOB|nr:DUF4177 domain-containing protein [Thalassorhabdomicrobium marinisediminis]PVA07036.1 DUF4177 domain-containing protein [Thalassorhabdomicrobium marinisediminis]
MFEYKVVPCPRKGLKAKGVKGAEAQFAHAMQTAMNEQAAEGWTYLRTDTWPMDERQGLTGKTTTFQTMMVFQRVVPAPEDDTPTAGLIEDQSGGAGGATDVAETPDAPDSQPPAEHERPETKEVSADAEHLSETDAQPDETPDTPPEDAEKPRA